MPEPWKPDWTLEPAPKGDDEGEVRELYERSMDEQHPGVPFKPWDELPEWARTAWRHEFRDL